MKYACCICLFGFNISIILFINRIDHFLSIYKSHYNSIFLNLFIFKFILYFFNNFYLWIYYELHRKKSENNRQKLQITVYLTHYLKVFFVKIHVYNRTIPDPNPTTTTTDRSPTSTTQDSNTTTTSKTPSRRTTAPSAATSLLARDCKYLLTTLVVLLSRHLFY